jgi:hypothetical protein
MRSWVNRAQFFLFLLALGFFASLSEAVIFESTSNVTFNTTAPTGGLTNSGWQYEGSWQGSYLGTPIAPTFFLAAIHIGGSVGDQLNFNGLSYHTIAFTDCPNSDLRVWQTAETFAFYAPLYTNSNEVGKTCVVFGRGTQRGDAVTVNSQLKGWKWGPGDGQIRWGENIITAINTNNEPTIGDLLQANFDRNGVTNECMLSVGDSSGGVFIQDGGVWKLTAINYATADPFVSTNGVNGSGFNAALVDYGGLYTGGDGNWTLIPNQAQDIPAYFVSSRVSQHVAWINSVINFQLGPDMQIGNIAPMDADIQISLATGSNRLYLIEGTSDLVTGTWTTVSSNVLGNGGIVAIIDTNATTQSKRFYRVKFLQ